MNSLQTLVLPNFELPAPEDLSVRLDARAWVRMALGRIDFEAGGLLSTDTFYNGLSVANWKRCCELPTLQLSLQGEGEFVLRLGLHREGLASIWLAESSLSLTADAPLRVPIEAWPQLQTGLLFWTLRALRPGSLHSAAYVTPAAPLQPVRLGIVITHFNRRAQVLPALERIERQLLDKPELAPHLSLTVVDNSCNLDRPDSAAVRVIPSRNLGGTGGFTRGLLALMDDGAAAATHALFMDDDASCEMESIARTLALLRYARDPRQAVSGALLREAAPWHLLEKGAHFRGRVQPICPGLDMRHLGDLLRAERCEQPDYGAWWFFAFPLAEVKRWPFPFFVRGDDVQFGLANRFAIATMNGIACVGEDFGVKHGPLTAYLDARYHLVLGLLDAGHRAAARAAWWVAGRLFVKQLASYHYTSARAVALALRHVLQGPAFFTHQQLDMAPIRQEIARWQPDEKLKPLDPAELACARPAPTRETRLHRFCRVLSLQGFLLPRALLKRGTLAQDKAFHGRAAAVFRYRRVLYEHRPSGTGYIAEYDRPRFFAELRAFLPLFWQLLRRLPTLQAQFTAAARSCGEAEFWRQVHDQPAPPRAGQPLPAFAPAAPAANAAPHEPSEQLAA